MTQDFHFLADGRRAYTLPDGRKIPRIWSRVVSGEIPLEELDDDELSRGQLKDKNGNFVGRAGKLIPKEIADRRTRLLMQRVQEQFTEVALKASQAFIDVLEDPNADHKDKMQAARYLHDRFLGKVPERVELSAEIKPWEGLVAGVLKEVPE